MAVTTCLPAASAQYVREGGLDSAHGFDDHLDPGVVDQPIGVVGDRGAPQGDAPRLAQVADGDTGEPDGPAGPARDSVGMLKEEPRTPVPTVPKPIKPTLTCSTDHRTASGPRVTPY